MTNNSSSTMEVPQAKDAMDKFKMEVASKRVRCASQTGLQR